MIDFTSENKKKKNHRRLIGRIIFYFIFGLLVLIFVIGILALVYGTTLARAYGAVLDGKSDLEVAAQYAADRDLGRAVIYVKKSKNDFTLAAEELQGLKVFSNFPVVGRQLVASEKMLDIGVNLTSSASQILEWLDDILKPLREGDKISFNNLDKEKRQYLLKRMYEAPPILQGAKAEMELAMISLDTMPKEGLIGPIKEAAGLAEIELPRVEKIVEGAIPIIQVVPALAGYPEEKTYLLLFQNNSELRPTGGFIGTYGVLKINNGDITNFFVDDIYSIDGPAEKNLKLNIEPPPPIKKYLVPKWFMRDANWTPDFPRAAEQVIWFYNKEKRSASAPAPQMRGGASADEVDGVIAFDPELAGGLMSLVGDLEVDGKVYTPENLLDLLQYEVEVGYFEKDTPFFDRKKVVGELAQLMVDRLKSLSAAKWLDLLEIIERSLSEKHLLLYDHDQVVESFYKNQDWGGEVKSVPTNSDYLFVVDSNLASLKTDRVIDRAVNYTVEKKDGKLVVHLELDYQNNGWFDYRTSRLRSYTRVYVPQGSRLISAKGIMDKERSRDNEPADVYDEFDKTVFGGFFAVEPKTDHKLIFEYELPTTVNANLEKDGVYTLFVQKQPGITGRKTEVMIRLDDGKERAWESDLKTDEEVIF